MPSPCRIRRWWPLLVFVTIISVVLTQWHLNTFNMFKRTKKEVSYDGPPHIIFILADDYGYNDVGYHGSKIRTPNLDKLSEQGVRLENYYVQPICTPTRSQLLSGRYQIHTGMQHGLIRPHTLHCHPLEDKMLPQVLRDQGYATHMVGKWHIGLYTKDCWPTRRGFDSFFGFLGAKEDHFTHNNTLECSDNFKEKNDNPEYCSWQGLDLRNNEDTVYNYTGVYSTHMFTSHAQRVIENHDSTKPLFLYVSYQAVHYPLQVPQRYLDAYGAEDDVNRRIYAGMTTCMDEGIGNITRTLKSAGLWEKSVVIFSSDNGGAFAHGGINWPLRGEKHSLWEGGIRAVGFVASDLLDDSVKGTVYNGLLHVTDWFPTLVEGLNNATAVSELDLDGYNVWNAISTGSESPRTEILHNIDNLYRKYKYEASLRDYMLPHNEQFNSYVRAAIRVGDWKLLTGNPGNGSWIPPPDSGIDSIIQDENWTRNQGHIWLFNIAHDPNETKDLSESRPGIVRRLYTRLLEYSATSVPHIEQEVDMRADPLLHNRTWSNWV